MSYLCCIFLEFFIFGFYGQRKLRITLSRDIETSVKNKLINKLVYSTQKEDISTSVYSCPQYMLVSSGKDMIFRREESICRKKNRCLVPMIWNGGKNKIKYIHIAYFLSFTFSISFPWSSLSLTHESSRNYYPRQYDIGHTRNYYSKQPRVCNSLLYSCCLGAFMVLTTYCHANSHFSNRMSTKEFYHHKMIQIANSYIQ